MKVLFLFLGLMVFAVTSLQAAGPLLVDTEGTGDAVLWQNNVIHLNMESGPDGNLGLMSNAEATALVRDLFDVWASVTIDGIPTVDIVLDEGPGLGSVDIDNVDDHFSYCPPGEICPSEDPPFNLGSARNGESPLLFDADGSMTDAIQGAGASRSILGFAGPRVVERVGGVVFIIEGQGLLNGRFIDGVSGPTDPEVTLEDFEGVIFHELGHFIGLDHTQVNLGSALKALQGDPTESEAIPTMFPIFIDGVTQLTPHFDDRVSISTLYPTAAFEDSFCRMEGTVFRVDGESGLQGVNVVASGVDDPLNESTSFVSGSFYTGVQTTCDLDFGDFFIAGLSPGVDYELKIEQINRAFSGGSSIEPCDPSQAGFDAKTLPGVYRCESGGEVITAGTEATTQVITNKESVIPTPTPSSSGGCSLLPN